MVGNYYTLRALCPGIRTALQGRRLEQIYSQDRDEAVLVPEQGGAALMVLCGSEGGTFFLQPRHARARRNSADVLRAAVGRTIATVSLHPADRRLEIVLEDGGSLVTLVRGPHSNLLLVDPEGTILDAFRHARTLAGTRLPAVEETPTGSISDPGRTVLSALKSIHPRLGALLLREVLFRIGIPETASASSLSSADARRLDTALAGLLEELASGAPRVYPNLPGLPGGMVFSLVDLGHLHPAAPRVFSDVHEAVRFRVHRGRSHSAFDAKKRALLQALGKEDERLRRAGEAMRADLESSSRADEYERNGHLVLAAAGGIVRGSDRVTLADDRGPVSIPLDPALTAHQNAERWFTRAKRARAARTETERRLAECERRRSAALQDIERAESVTSLEELQELMDARKRNRSAGAPVADDAGEAPLFRVFTVDGGFQVLAGKSSANNDLLTMKHARPDDLWFHARGSSGSHVVLRVGTGSGAPGKRAREQAAGIAAYYSRMRNASMVPVTMTERKYVRKPKGAAPGSVVVEREKVVFAAPALPEGSREEAT